MDSKKQKQKVNHVVIVTSEAADASVKQYRIKPWLFWTVVIVICVIIGAGLGYIAYEEQIWDAANARIEEYKQIVKGLEEEIEQKEAEKTALLQDHEAENKAYQLEIDELNNKLTVMSDTINQKVEEVNELNAQWDVLYEPTTLPLTGAASIEEVAEGEPLCKFTASEGALVVATANGMVTSIVEEPEYGYKVTVDHDNGYVTIYRNKAVPKVKQGEPVMRGVAIFVVGEDNLTLGYQITKDGSYINPMEMMEIEG
ncbi:MAG: M23 family metallopeptidase [Lachnospiraceae bacterium]|nr:M23 family metallopeptidase [Lachnospiraceae bacterium]